MLNNTQTFINSEGYIFFHLMFKENENVILFALLNLSIMTAFLQNSSTIVS